MMALNPVERRLALLCADWLEFRADASKRLLVWQVPDHALRLVHCFVQAQKHDLPYSSRDLFIAFDAPFEHSLQYACALKEQLQGEVQASRAELAARGVDPNWSFDPAALPDTAAAVMGALRSFGSGHHQAIGHLAAVLLPADVSNGQHWADWLLRALQAGLPERLRLVVVDSLDQPRLAALTPQRDARISLRRPAVDGLATAQETFAQEATVGPAGVFRQLLMAVVGLMERGTAGQVCTRAADALAFARRQGWPDQEVVLHTLVAGALLKEARHAEAVQAYRAARQSAMQALQAAHPAGHKLVLQTWFGEAGAHLAAGDLAAAAGCYDTAAPLALEDRNPLMAVEAWRMGAFCHARNDDPAGAQQRSRQALALGRQLPPEARSQSTLPLVALDLLRVMEPAHTRQLEQVQVRLQGRLNELRRQAEQRAAAAEDSALPESSTGLQAQLDHNEDEAHAQAELELQTAVAGAPAPWREHFEHARDLLGPDWPLRSAWAAAPVAPQEPAP